MLHARVSATVTVRSTAFFTIGNLAGGGDINDIRDTQPLSVASSSDISTQLLQYYGEFHQQSAKDVLQKSCCLGTSSHSHFITISGNQGTSSHSHSITVSGSKVTRAIPRRSLEIKAAMGCDALS
jgi:hypothetical protein